jgi:hypothetical protein
MPGLLAGSSLFRPPQMGAIVIAHYVTTGLTSGGVVDHGGALDHGRRGQTK